MSEPASSSAVPAAASTSTKPHLPAIQIPTHATQEFTVFGTVFAKPDLADRLAHLYTLTTALARSEEGTLYYAIARDPVHAHVFYFHETYAGRAAFDRHNDSWAVRCILREGLFDSVQAGVGVLVDGVGEEELRRAERVEKSE